MSISKTEIKKFTSLNRKSKRKEHGLFLAEGEKICGELLKSNIVIEAFFATNKHLEKFPDARECTVSELNKISKLKNTSEVLAVCKIPEKSKYMDDQKPLFFLDGINDPGNMGSILRSLDWFGYQQVFCSNHTVDSYNNKVVMASMGAVFRVNAFYLDFKDFKTKFKNHTTYVATMDGETIHSKMLEKKSIFVIGNESHGVSGEIKNQTNKKIKIPGFGFAESLNAGVATGIILYEFSKNV